MSYDSVGCGRILIAFMRILGLWCPRADKWQRISRFVLHAMIILPLLMSLYYQIIFTGQADNLADALFIGLSETDFLAKLLTIAPLRQHAFQFVELIQDQIVDLKTEAERKMFQKSHRILGLLHKMYITMCMTYWLMNAVRPFLTTNWKLPFAGDMPFEWRSTEVYWYVYGYQLVVYAITILSNATFDIFMAFTIMQCALYYKVIGMRMEAIGVVVVKGKQPSDEDALKELVGIIEMRKFVDRMALECEKIVSFPIFIQAVLSALILCFTGYKLQSISLLDSPVQFLQMIDFAGVMTLQIYLPCYYGNQITFNTDNLTNALYNSNWTDLSLKTRKMMVIYMEFLKRPVIIKAGNFFVMGLPVFSKVINYAYSLYALLLNTK